MPRELRIPKSKGARFAGNYQDAATQRRMKGVGNTGGFVQAKQRTPVVGPQLHVIMAASVRTNEREHRAIQSRGTDDVYGAPAQQAASLVPRAGEVVLCELGPERTLRTCLTTDTPVTVIARANNLARDTPVGLPCVTEGEVNKFNNQVALNLHGVVTVINFGSDTFGPGDHVYVDPNPYMVSDPMGAPHPATRRNELPGVRGPYNDDGVPAVPVESQRFALRRMGPVELHAFLTHAKDSVLQYMSDQSDKQSFMTRALTITSAQQLMRLMQDTIKLIFMTSFVIAIDHPVRSYALVFMANRMYDMACLLVDEQGTNTSLAGIALQTKLLVLRHVSDTYEDVRVRYERFLPHRFRDVVREENSSSVCRALQFNTRTALMQKLLRHNFTSATPAQAVSAAHAPAAPRAGDERSNDILFGDNDGEEEDQTIDDSDDPSDAHSSAPVTLTTLEHVHITAHLNMHGYDMLELMQHRVRNYLETFFLGTCLTSGGKGQTLDIFLGKK